MQTADLLGLALGAVRAHRLRSFLTGLGIAVGIAAVVLLTSIGEGVHQFVLAEFTQFGTNLLGIAPGKTTTHGVAGAVISNVRPLTLEDAEALRAIPCVEAVAPVLQGNAQVEAGARSRRTTVLGVGHQAPTAWQFEVGMGRFLPPDDPRAPRAFAVLGSTLHEELFGEANPLGERIRVGGMRYRIVGVMRSKGQFLGFDLDDTVYIPAARALELFNRDSLMEVDLLYCAHAEAQDIADAARRILVARHGQEDFTITTQDQMMEVLGSVLGVLTFAVGAVGGISLLVGGVGVLTIMSIAVNERTREIGLLRALGARQGQVLGLFLGEAVLLAAAGGLAGLALGVGTAQLLHLLLPALPVHTPWEYALAALALAAAVGLAAGVLPARRAARMDPVEALRAE
jgi:putative ABC transport system permease protein